MLDLCYEEDVTADTDMNIVCTGSGNFVEVQGTAEGVPFDRALLNQLLDLGFLVSHVLFDLRVILFHFHFVWVQTLVLGRGVVMAGTSRRN